MNKEQRDNMEKSFDDWLLDKALSALCSKTTCENCLLNSNYPNNIGDCSKLTSDQLRAVLCLVYKVEIKR